MHGNKGVVYILLGELQSVVESYLYGCGVRGIKERWRATLFDQLWVRTTGCLDLWGRVASAVGVRPAVSRAFNQMVELLALPHVAQPIHAVIHTPHLLGRRLPSEAYGVVQTGGEHSLLATGGIYAKHRGTFLVCWDAHVTGATYGNVEHAVRSEGDSTIRMLASNR